MLSSNLQTESGGARPSNATGFRDATQVRGVVESAQGFPVDDLSKASQKTPDVEQDKVLRPPMWDELDKLYTLVDATALPRELQDNEVRLPWANIWSDKGDMDKLVAAVGAEIDGLEDGQSRKDLSRVWDDMSDGSDLDTLDSDLDL